MTLGRVREGRQVVGLREALSGVKMASVVAVGVVDRVDVVGPVARRADLLDSRSGVAG